MARLFPSTLDHLQPTWGEERVFAMLRAALRPDEDHWAWYEPLVHLPDRGRVRPDFVLAGAGYGVVVLEVKDWTPAGLTGGGRRQVSLREGDGHEKRATHPEEQVRGYAHRVRDLLVRTPGLTHERGPHAGELAVPVNGAVLFTRMTSADLDRLEKRGIVFRREKCLTAEVLERNDEEGGRRLRAALERACDILFPFDLSPMMRSRLRAALQPQIHFLDVRGEDPSAGAGPAPPPETEIPEAPARPPMVRVPLPELPGFFLDRKQERMARSLASPRTLVYGPAGSGKTVFLVARARYWLDLAPEASVLFTCYNASLASHIRNVFALKGVSADGGRLTVLHYHDVCRRMLGMGEDFHEKAPDFYAALEPRVLRELSQRDDFPTYDLVLVDEGQDFTRRMMEVLVRLIRPGGEITVVCDPAQDLYGRWSEGNLDPMGRPAVERLVDCYRNTAPIFELALSVLSPETRAAMGLNRLEMTRPEDLGRTGPPPELAPLGGLDDLVSLIAKVVREFDAEGRPLSELAVLYPHRHAIPNFPGRLRHSRWAAAGDPRFTRAGEDAGEPDEGEDPEREGHFADALERELRARDVPVEWVARDFASKAAYDISKTRLTLSTVHSAKGMDFHTVILLGAEVLAYEDESRPGKAASILFTGITRARDRLVIPYFLDQGWVPHLRERLPLDAP